MAALEDLLSNLHLRVLAGGCTRLWPEWGAQDQVLPTNRIYYCRSGSGGFALDGVKHKFRPRMVALLPANHRLSCWNDPKDPMEQLWFHFDARIMGLVDLFQAVLCPAPFVERGSQIEDLLCKLLAAAEHPSPYEVLMRNGLLAQALAVVLREAKPPAAEALLRGPGDRMGRVLQHIAANYPRHLSVADLAAVARLNPMYFSNMFRKATGSAPMAFLQKYRVERAKSLLASSDEPVKEIAQQVGFADPFHFSRVFKKLAGAPPSAFQESLRR
jgi:AraC family transcriptional regulator, arabinose operon regulatory protein